MKPSHNSDPQQQPSPKAPEPSSESQVDIALRVQKDLKQSKDRREQESQAEPAGRKATQFDGSPNPHGDEDSGVFKPADDTPAVLEKRSGPKNPG